MKSLQVTPAQKQLIFDILKVIKNPIYFFGSRVKGTAKTLSDLDIVIKESIDPVLLSEVREAFEESHLPFKVDIVLWERMDKNFQDSIQQDLLARDDIK
jgi:predicted nucleotidyltransferase